MTLDRVDRAIIAELSKDSRLSVRALSERVHISRTAANNRVQNLIASGVLTEFVARVDRKAIGLNLTALVIVNVASAPPWREIASSLAALPFVESVLAVSGDIDFVVTVSAPGQDQLTDVILRQIHELPGVISTRSHIVLDTTDGTAPGLMRDVWPT